ncbi:MAG TPA: type 1 glutamine amidotransferase domain-containing protein [Gaiellaceae bacterium]|nr:type 1 glutamine amidotransferase domain-containing protein [Gaiellaceae bacterium]
MPDLTGTKVAVIATDMVEQVELTEPRKALEDAGAEVELISIEEGEIQGFDHYDKASTFPVDRAVDDADPDDYDALLLPGGVGNPDTLRTNERVVDFVRRMFDAGKPIAAICHGPWTLVEAGVVDGLTLTSWPSLKTDIRNAGGTWVDEEVHVDQGVTTSRKPDDIPAFNRKMVEEFAEGRHEARRVSAHANA